MPPRLVALLLALGLASACGGGADGTSDGARAGAAPEAGAQAAEARASEAGPAEVRAFRGMMAYMADAASFTACEGGAFFPIAAEGAYLELERAYLAAQGSPGAPVLVEVEGAAPLRPGPDGGAAPALLVARVLGVYPGQGCDAAPSPPLEGTEWVGVSVDGAPLPEGVEATLHLAPEERRVSGSGGCNRFSGAYELAGGRLTFGTLAATRRACPGPAMDAEAAFLAALGRAGSYRLEGDRLELLGEAGPVTVLRAR